MFLLIWIVGYGGKIQQLVNSLFLKFVHCSYIFCYITIVSLQLTVYYQFNKTGNKTLNSTKICLLLIKTTIIDDPSIDINDNKL